MSLERPPLSRRALLGGGFLREFARAAGATARARSPRWRGPASARVARVSPLTCVAFRGVSCASCVERCPLDGALRVDYGRPVVDANVCDGCGECVPACPAPGPAIAVVERTS
jgi:ferredoxin